MGQTHPMPRFILLCPKLRSPSISSLFIASLMILVAP